MKPSKLVSAVLVGIATIMIGLNLYGALALLGNAPSLAVVPAVRLLVSAADADPAILRDGIRFEATSVAARLRASGGDFNFDLDERPADALGHLDDLTVGETGRVSIRGWVAGADATVDVEFVGVVLGDQVAGVGRTDQRRPDVEAALGANLPSPGFDAAGSVPPGTHGCEIGVMAVYSDMTFAWLHRPTKNCPPRM